MSILRRTYSATLFLAALSACATSANIQAVEQKEIIEVQVGATAKPVQFRKIVVRMPRNKIIGAVQGGMLCLPASDLQYRGGRIAIEDEEYNDVFREELEAANYVVVGDPDALFDDPDSWRAEFLIGGLIRDMQANICFPYNGFGNFSTSSGEASMEVEWQIYSRLNRQVVYEVKTNGSASVSSQPNGADKIFVEAFAQAARNLLADKKFHDLITGQTETASLKIASAASQSIETTIEAVELSQLRFQEHVTDIRSQVVTIYAGDGLGSGFFINDGYLLTNQHVVGGAKFIKVRLVTGREIVGEVLKTDSARDVALVKTENIGVTGLPLRLADVGIGSQVFVVGSPLEESLQSTVTAGIVSAYRIEDGQRFIQSDVNVQPGNSGGPMFDENGNVIGLTVQGISAQGYGIGVNFFVPIQDALNALIVRVKGWQS